MLLTNRMMDPKPTMAPLNPIVYGTKDITDPRVRTRPTTNRNYRGLNSQVSWPNLEMDTRNTLLSELAS